MRKGGIVIGGMLFLVGLVALPAPVQAAVYRVVAMQEDVHGRERVRSTQRGKAFSGGVAPWRALSAIIWRLPWRDASPQAGGRSLSVLVRQAELPDLPLRVEAKGCRKEAVGDREALRCMLSCSGAVQDDDRLRAQGVRWYRMACAGTMFLDAGSGESIAGWMTLRQAVRTELWHASGGVEEERGRLEVAWALLP